MTKPFATVVDIAKDIASGKTSAVEVLEQHLARITEREGEINACYQPLICLSRCKPDAGRLV